MSRQTLDFYKDQLKNTSFEALQVIVDNATEMPLETKMLFHVAVSRGTIESCRSAIARWLYVNQPTDK
jgi:hypothetical protein